MTDPEQAFNDLNREPTAVFGCWFDQGLSEPQTAEVVGPLKPDHTYYGYVHRSDCGNAPLVFLGFNKYRSDLPPWQTVHEFLLASEDNGTFYAYAFTGGVEHMGTRVTGDLKTVTMSAEYVHGDYEDALTIIDGEL